jgi:hypothetical protein
MKSGERLGAYGGASALIRHLRLRTRLGLARHWRSLMEAWCISGGNRIQPLAMP